MRTFAFHGEVQRSGIGLVRKGKRLLGAGKTAAAHADAIDGNWCFDDGRHMSIEGPQIVTPGGAAIVGNYGRHSFSYTAPTAEPGGGGEVSMVLVNEDTVHLMPGVAAGSDPEVWRRCEFTS